MAQRRGPLRPTREAYVLEEDTMKIDRLSMALALSNLALLTYVVAAPRSTRADGAPPVLRGRALEIVDDQGRVRASITVLPANPAGPPDGKPYLETVILRLIDGNGRPEVKVAASEHGGGLGLVGESDKTAVVLQAEGASSSLKLTDKEGREQFLKPQ